MEKEDEGNALRRSRLQHRCASKTFWDRRTFDQVGKNWEILCEAVTTETEMHSNH